MKKLFAITFLFFAVTNISSAQFDESIAPKSFKNTSTEIPEIILPEFNSTGAQAEDLNDSKNGVLAKFSRSIYTNINLANSGTWTTLSNGDRIWRVKVTSAKALGLVPLFDRLYLPEGALLHVYMPDHEEILGAYIHSNTPEPRSFCSGLIHGESCIIEYFEPASVKGLGIVSLNEVGHAYRWVTPLKEANDAAASGSCEVNVACSEATAWEEQVRAVARILVVATGGQGYCSGALINNARQDCTPYFLSAQHCSEGATTAQYNQWVFYFNYQASTCAGTTGPQNKLVNGCTKIADSNDNGGATGSDFLLLQLKTTPSAAFNVFYAGWDNSGASSPSGFCIHHPDGDIKKISTYTQTTTSTSWGGSAQNTHWNVKWSQTANGRGVTEPGSSGSPLFNNQGIIIGTLTGGNSYCSSPNSPDQYGKFAYDWISNGTANNRRLKPWLDPDNTGITMLAGTNAPCGSSAQNDAGIQLIEAPTGNLCTSTITPSVLLRNYGGNTLQTVTINYEIDGNVSQYTFNGNLNAGGTLTINLPAVSLGPGTHTFVAQTILPNGSVDSNTNNDSQTSTFIIVPDNGNLLLQLTTDNYGSETTWDIENQANNVVASGGPYGDVNGGETINTSICLAAGCYTLNLHDSDGDGMSFGGHAAMQLTGSTGTPLYAELGALNFGTDVSYPFCIAGTTTGISNINTPAVSVWPNPSTGLFNLNFGNDGEKTIKVFDAVGRLVSTEIVAAMRYNVNLSAQPKGIYLLQVETKEGSVKKKLVLD